MQFHKDGTKPKEEGWIWVFGSNLAGMHGAGAAKVALREYGAMWDIGAGLMGNSYAIATKSRRLRTLPLDVIEPQVELFKNYALKRDDLRFFVTAVGCGLAGYDHSDIAPMFKGSPDNCSFPEEWKEWLSD